MEPIIDHIQITVRDMDVAVPFYDKFLPLLGFDPRRRNSAVIKDHEFHVVEYVHPRLAFAITSPRPAVAADAVHRRRPGALHHSILGIIGMTPDTCCDQRCKRPSCASNS
jgi:catechol 2,3-dioxygenase-like lactoylglutathione lyase family enzyme